MPTPPHPSSESLTANKFFMAVTVFGPIRIASDLNRHMQRALKSHTSGRDYFTDITLQSMSHSAGLQVEYTVTAQSPQGARAAGAVYMSQLCDLISVVTRSPLWFYMPDDDSINHLPHSKKRSTTIDRILSEPEWSWITGNLVYLRREHPRFLAAASWYRKGLLGRDSLDDLCCYWRAIERIAYSYADKSTWTDENRKRAHIKQCVEQLTSDIFRNSPRPAALEPDHVNRIVKLRNDISHGNIPITIELIDAASDYLEELENAAYGILAHLRETVLTTACAVNSNTN